MKEGRIAVVGAGRMGETLMRAMISAGVAAPQEIVATRRQGDRLEALGRELGIHTTRDNREACAEAEMILLCIKPQGAEEILAELDDQLGEEHLLVSILAGVSTRRLESFLSRAVPVVRAMPNTPSLLGEGMTALCPGAAATPEHVAAASRVFERVGRVMTLDESYFDAVTGLSASGPAFIYIVIEALAEGGVKVGLPRDVATELAAQTCLGAARMVIETGQHPAVLKDAVTTPAGCTIDGIEKLEEGGLRVTLIKAIVEAARRSRELVQ